MVLERAGVRVDPARHDVSRDGQAIALTPKELAVLEALLVADGAIVSPERLLDQVWDEHVDPFTNVVRVTIMTLRKKLGAPPLIETVVGAGYRIP
jgi:DNA-binding response OmpR family regulator